jgi:hypothetical protein
MLLNAKKHLAQVEELPASGRPLNTIQISLLPSCISGILAQNHSYLY